MLSDADKLNVVNLYQAGLTAASIGRRFGVSKQAIGGLLKRRAIPIRNDQSALQRKYHLNNRYFAVIDSREKAYFLGLIYADGCVSKNGASMQMKISLQAEDSYILKWLSNSLYGCDRVVLQSPRNEKCKEQSRLCIFDRRFVEDIERLGCHERKSKTIRLQPVLDNLKPELLPSFLLGYFDGDGGVYSRLEKNKNGTPFCYIHITSNLDFLNDLAGYLSDHDIGSSIGERRTSPGYGTLRIDRLESILRFYKLCLNSSPIRMSRKWAQLEHFVHKRKAYLIIDPNGVAFFDLFLSRAERRLGLTYSFLTDIKKGRKKNHKRWTVRYVPLTEILSYV